MDTNITTAADTATPGDYYKALTDRAALATSLEATVSYLENCIAKHGDAGMAAAHFSRASRNCQRLADELKKLKDDNAALIRYRNILFELDEAQLEAFARIKIDYQAHISSDFQPVTTNHFLAELQAIAFAVAAINKPVCMGGVGAGFGPRLKLSEAA